MPENKKVVFISDFDGTVSKKDFFWYVIEKYLKESDIQPWLDYKEGHIHHVDALARIFGKVRVEESEFNEFVLTLPIEEKFVDTVKLCEAKDIPVYILSAGADYYINYIMKHLSVDDLVTVLSNKSIYSKEQGLQFINKDSSIPYYSVEYGISKKDFVKDCKDKGYFCVYAGDGNPDFEAAKLADIVFARETLLERCNDAGVETEQFITYQDIYNFLNKIN